MIQFFVKFTEIFLLWNCVTFFYRRFFNVHTSSLFCGLFGFSGDSPPNLAKLKILGINNETRGRDSCGIFYNGKLVKGVGPNKVFSDLLENYIVKQTEEFKNNTFIGHTRMATVGAHTAANAHPFLLDDKIVFAHNGVIKNIDDLLEKYNIDKKENNIEVDSQGLGLLLHREGKKVLEEYRGYAAILATDVKDPNTLWVFRGASKEWDYTTSVLHNERPLFYAVHKEGIYLSSLEEGLKMIRDGEGQDPIELPVNTLIKIKGSTMGVEEYSIARETCNIGINEKKVTVVTPTTNVFTERNRYLQKPAPSAQNCVVRELPFRASQPLEKCNIQLETYPPKVFAREATKEDIDFIFFWRGRFYNNSDKLCEGKLFLDKDGTVYSSEGPGVYESYFYKGVMIENERTYNYIMDEIASNSFLGLKLSMPRSYNFAKEIAPYSKYPVTNLIDEAVNVATHEISSTASWYMRDSRNKKDFSWTLANHSFTPMYSADRNYVFRGGDLINIVPNNPKDVLFTSASTTKYSNQDINKSTKINIPLKDVNEAVSKGTLKGVFKRKFLSIEEFEVECPSTVKLALQYYIEDLLTTGNHFAATTEVLTVMDTFIETMIRDGISIEDGMVDTVGIQTIEDYIKAAQQFEARTIDKPEQTSSFDPKELDKLADELKIETSIRQGVVVANLLKKKGLELGQSKDLLKREISENFVSCHDLIKETLNHIITNNDDSGRLLKNDDLLKIINR